jgi:hypothetical protein
MMDQGNAGANPQLSPDTVYQVLAQLVNQSETTGWNRLNMFLLANSILILAWVALFQVKGQEPWLEYIKWGIPILGALLALLWIPFSTRGRRYVIQYIAMARELEEVRIQSGPRPFTCAHDDSLKWRWPERKVGRSILLAPLVPFLFFALYLFLLLFLFSPVQLPLWQGLLPPVLAFALAVGVVTFVWLWRSLVGYDKEKLGKKENESK